MKYGALNELPCIHSAEELRAAIEFLEETPARLEASVAGLSEAQLRFKPKADVFSLTENVLHLRDIEVEGYARRLRRILAEEAPVLPDIDGRRLSIERRYNEQQLAPALAQFAASRRENVAVLRGITAEDLTRTADMEAAGRITLAQLIQMWREHDAAHRAELEELRRLVETLEPGKRT
jgi:hypothetical protein